MFLYKFFYSLQKKQCANKKLKTNSFLLGALMFWMVGWHYEQNPNWPCAQADALISAAVCLFPHDCVASW